MGTAYGRLDVFWPDGLLNTYILTEENTSIGRSPGNTIPLDTSAISRYHVSITRRNDETFLTDLDSANGTHVDNVRIPHNEPKKLFGGEEIQIGDLRLFYNDLDESPTRPFAVPEETTVRIELPEMSFNIEVEGPEIAIAPGAHASAKLRISNQGEAPERYTIQVAGVPKEWLRIDRREVEVAPKKSVEVSLSFKPLRRSESQPGDYTIEVDVSPKSDPTQKLTARFVLRILPYGGFGLALERRHLPQTEAFLLHLHNQGSGVLPISLSAQQVKWDKNERENLNFAFSPSHVVLQAGQRVTASVRVQPRKKTWFGEPHEHTFDIRAKSKTPAGYLIATRAYVTEKPPFPRWALFALIGVVFSALLLVALLLASLLNRDTTPEIREFVAAQEQVMQGEPVTLSWDVASTQWVRINVNGVEVETFTPDVRQANLDTSSYSGNIVITLRAENGNLISELSQQVEVVVPMVVEYFRIEPERPVRFVAQTITISWNIHGAVTTRLIGLEALTNSPRDFSYGQSATISVSSAPTDLQYALRIVAENGSGDVFEQDVLISLIDPQCVAQSAVTLYAEPNETSQVTSTVTSGTSVIVDGRDITGGWLRFGPAGWGLLSEFICADTFNPSDLLLEISVPTAMPDTLTPTASPTFTATVFPTFTPAPLFGATNTPPAGVSSPAPPVVTITPAS